MASTRQDLKEDRIESFSNIELKLSDVSDGGNEKKAFEIYLIEDYGKIFGRTERIDLPEGASADLSSYEGDTKNIPLKWVKSTKDHILGCFIRDKGGMGIFSRKPLRGYYPVFYDHPDLWNGNVYYQENKIIDFKQLTVESKKIRFESREEEKDYYERKTVKELTNLGTRLGGELRFQGDSSSIIVIVHL